MPDAVIFDLDGVLLDSEQRWNEIKRAVTEENGGAWRDDAPHAMMGMSSPEWSAYIHDELGVPLSPQQINDEVVRRMAASYEQNLPLLPGAMQAVQSLTWRWPLGLASSSNREVIDSFLRLTNLGPSFRVTISSEEVERGKPAPDVYLETASRLGADPTRTVAIEDSSNGIRAAKAAGMKVIAIPNPHYPPAPDALALADLVIDGVARLNPSLIEGLAPDTKTVRGRRMKAGFADIGVLLVPLVVFGFVAGEIDTGPDTYGLTLTGIPFLLYAAFVLAYYFVLEWANGQTLGKRWLDLRVVDASGNAAGVGAVAIRTALRIIDWLPLFYLVGYISIRSTGDRVKRLGDMAARTFVRPAAEAPARAALSPALAAAALAVIAGITLAGTYAWRDARDDFIRSADAVCARANAELEPANARIGQASSQREAVAALREVHGLALATTSELEGLEPPGSLADSWSDYTANVRAQTELIAAALAAAERDDPETYRQKLLEVNQRRQALESTLEDADFEQCGVTLLDVGWFASPAGIWRRDDDMDRQARYPVPAYVIETERSGSSSTPVSTPAAVEDPAAHYSNAEAFQIFELEQEKSIAESVDLSSLTRVVLTHLHFDHAGSLSLVPPSVPVVVQRREWEAGQDPEAVKKKLFSTPGHTPGQLTPTETIPLSSRRAGG